MTNYEKNKEDWNIGDLVIHDADAKKEYMLMEVIKITNNDYGKIYHTKYKYGRRKKIWKNGKECLHNPNRFNIRCNNTVE